MVVVPNHFGVHIRGRARSGPRLREGARYRGGEVVGHEAADDAEAVQAALRMPKSWATSLAVPGEPAGSDGIGLRARADSGGALPPLR